MGYDQIFQVIARYRPKTGNYERVIELLAGLAAETRMEKACLSFEYFRSAEDPREILILENFVDAAGFAAHRDAVHSRRINVEQILPLLEDRSSSKGVVTPL